MYDSIMMDKFLPQDVKNKITLYYRNDKRLSIEKLNMMLKLLSTRRTTMVGGMGDMYVYLPPLKKQRSNGEDKDWIPIPHMMEPPLPMSPSPTPPTPPTFGYQSTEPPKPFGFDISNFANLIKDEDVVKRIIRAQSRNTNSGEKETLPNIDEYGNSIKLTKLLGEGSYARVYDIVSTPARVIKLYKTGNVINFGVMIDNIKENIRDFCNKFTPFAQNNTTLLIVNNSDNINWFDNPSGYVMNKYIPINLKENTLSHVDLVTILNTCIKYFTIPQTSPPITPRFIHGDVKFDNILLKNSNQHDNVVLNDLDGVLVYDTNTLLPISRRFKREYFATPATAHPLYFYYFGLLSKTPEFQSQLQITDNILNCTLQWKSVIGQTLTKKYKFGPTDKSLAEIYMDELNSILSDDDNFKIEKFLSDGLNSDDPLNFLRTQMANMDIYSLGATAFFHYNLEYLKYMQRQAQSPNQTPVQEPPDNLYTFAQTTLRQALGLPPIGGSSRHVGGGDRGCGCAVANFPDLFSQQRTFPSNQGRPTSAKSRPQQLTSSSCKVTFKSWVCSLLAADKQNVIDNIIAELEIFNTSFIFSSSLPS